MFFSQPESRHSNQDLEQQIYILKVPLLAWVHRQQHLWLILYARATAALFGAAAPFLELQRRKFNDARPGNPGQLTSAADRPKLPRPDVEARPFQLLFVCKHNPSELHHCNKPCARVFARINARHDSSHPCRLIGFSTSKLRASRLLNSCPSRTTSPAITSSGASQSARQSRVFRLLYGRCASSASLDQDIVGEAGTWAFGDESAISPATHLPHECVTGVG